MRVVDHRGTMPVCHRHGACVTGIVIFERLLTRCATRLFDSHHLGRSVAIYTMLIVFSLAPAPCGVRA